MARIKTLLKFILGVPLTIVSFLFIGKALFSSLPQVISHLETIQYLPLFLGVIFLLLYFLTRALAWNLILKRQNYDVPATKSVFLFSYSETRRYIPGSIFSFISRTKLYREHVPTNTIIKSIGIEMGVLVLSGFFVSQFCFVFFADTFLSPSFSLIQRYTNGSNFLILGSVGTTLLLLGASLLYFRFRNKVASFAIESMKYVDVLFISTLGWFLFGIGNYFIAVSISYLNPYFFLQFITFFVFSWLIGYLSFVTPMGLGVREAIITVGLSPFLPLYLASSIAVLQRILLIIAELIFLGSARLILSMKKTWNIPYQLIILAGFVISYISYFSYVTYEKHLNFFTGRFDLGNMDQAVWNTLHGRIFLLTNPDSTNIISRLAIHADFILILLAPFYLLWQDPRMLLLIQSIIIGCGAIFVYLIGNFVLKNKNLSLIFSASYLLNPFIHKQNLFDFHGVALATTFLLATWYFLLKKRWSYFFIFLTLAVLTKENIYAIAALMGGYILIVYKKRIFGAAVIVGALVTMYLLINEFIPQARGGAHFALEYFSENGDSATGTLTTILLNPLKTVTSVMTHTNLDYIAKLLIPTGFLALFSPLYLLFASPDIAINILSKNVNLKSINFHYAAAIIPFVYISSMYGARELLAGRIPFVNTKTLFYYIACTSLATSLMYGIFPASSNPAVEVFNEKLEDRDEIKKYIETISPEKSVSATNNIGAHLSHREYIYTIPMGLYEADVVVFLLNDEFAQPSLLEQKQMAKDLANNTQYKKVYEHGDFVVFEKIR